MLRKTLCSGFYNKRVCVVLVFIIACYCLVELSIYVIYIDNDPYLYKKRHYHLEQIQRLGENDGWILTTALQTVANSTTLQLWDGSVWNIHGIMSRKYNNSSKCGGHDKDVLKEAALVNIRDGAKFIYLTSHDMSVVSESLSRFTTDPYMWNLQYSGLLSKPLHAHFTNTSTCVHQNTRYDSCLYELVVGRTSILQKGLRQQELDNKNAHTDITSTFTDTRSPSFILPARQTVEFLKEDILFHYDALWAIFPLSGNDYIWSLWVQRLLQELGSPVSFVTITGESCNSNLLNKDGSNAEILKSWRCESSLDFFDCVLSLSRFMKKEEIINHKEYMDISNWLGKLTTIGYRVPHLNQQNDGNTSLESVHRVLYSPAIESPAWNLSTFSHKCNNDTPTCEHIIDKSASNSLKHILAVIVFNTEGHYHIIEFLEKIYRPVFKYILYCGTNMEEFLYAYKILPYPVSFLEMQDDFEHGKLGYQCVQNAMRMNFDVDGYLHLSDDVLLNLWNLKSVPTDKIWFQENLRVANISQKTVPDVWRHPHWWPWQNKFGQTQITKAVATMHNLSDTDKRVKSFLNQLTHNSGSSERVFYEVCDIYYIPKRLAKPFRYLASIFDSHQVYLEIAIPNIINSLDGRDNIVKLKGEYLWYEDRVFVKETFSYNDVFLHPVKFGPCLVDDECVKFLCESYLSCL